MPIFKNAILKILAMYMGLPMSKISKEIGQLSHIGHADFSHKISDSASHKTVARKIDQVC